MRTSQSRHWLESLTKCRLDAGSLNEDIRCRIPILRLKVPVVEPKWAPVEG